MDMIVTIIPQLQILFLPKVLIAIAIREFMDIAATRKYQENGYYIAWYPFFIMWIYGVSLLEAPEIVKLLLNVTVTVAVLFVLYIGRWYHMAATAVVAILGDRAFDYLFMGVFSLIFGPGFEDAGVMSMQVFGAVMITKLTEMLTVKVAHGITRYRRMHVLKREDYFIYFLVPVVSIGTMDLIFADCIRNNEISVLLTYAMLGIVILDIAIFHIMHRMEFYYHEESNLRVINTNMVAQMENIKEIEQTHKRIRQLSHGITTQLSAIETLLRHHKYMEAEEYLKGLTDTVEQNMLPIHTNNIVIDALLNQRYILARSKGIKMRFDIQDLKFIKIRTADLVTILSNGLNNAIEACERVEEDRVIELKVMNSDRELLVSIQNTVAEDIVLDGSTPKTSKEDKFSHGLGLEGIRLVTENNNGHMFIECEHKKFKLVTVM